VNSKRICLPLHCRCFFFYKERNCKKKKEILESNIAYLSKKKKDLQLLSATWRRQNFTFRGEYFAGKISNRHCQNCTHRYSRRLTFSIHATSTLDVLCRKSQAVRWRELSLCHELSVHTLCVHCAVCTRV